MEMSILELRPLPDFLVSHGVAVRHILGLRELRPHAITPGAVVANGWHA
jgi:hypothetical protein